MPLRLPPAHHSLLWIALALGVLGALFVDHPQPELAIADLQPEAPWLAAAPAAKAPAAAASHATVSLTDNPAELALLSAR